MLDEIAHLETQPQSAQKRIQRNPAPALRPKAHPIFAPSHSFIENCLHCYDFFVILYLSINKNL